MTTVLKIIFFIALNWLLTCVWQDFVTVKKYRLVSIGNGKLSTRTRVILLLATPVGLRPIRAAPGIIIIIILLLLLFWSSVDMFPREFKN